MLITTTQAAQRLGLTREQVLRRIGRGDIAAQYVGGRWLVDAGSVERYAAGDVPEPGIRGPTERADG